MPLIRSVNQQTDTFDVMSNVVARDAQNLARENLVWIVDDMLVGLKDRLEIVAAIFSARDLCQRIFCFNKFIPFWRARRGSNTGRTDRESCRCSRIMLLCPNPLGPGLKSQSAFIQILRPIVDASD